MTSESTDRDLWVTLYTARGNNEIDNRKERLCQRLDSLRHEGRIADYDTFSIPTRINSERPHTRDDHVEAFRQFQRWASRNSLTLEPFFSTEQGGDILLFPNILLVVRSVPHRLYSLPTSDRDTSGLQGVFPCADGEEQYSIENYLKSIEEGRDWRDRSEFASPTTPDYGAHGAIKGHVFQNPAETVGEVWELPKDEEELQGGTEDDTGRVDIVFRHQSNEKWLLVEVKPDKQQVDSAIGQLGRYKYNFLADTNLPHLSPGDIHLAIAAPDFYDSHRKVAEEWSIRLIEVGGQYP